MSRGTPRADALSAQALKAAQQHIRDVQLEMMVDPWTAAGVGRPPDAPGMYRDKAIGLGQVPLVNRIELAHYLATTLTGIQSVINIIVNEFPQLQERMHAEMNRLAQLKDVAEQQMEEPDND